MITKQATLPPRRGRIRTSATTIILVLGIGLGVLGQSASAMSADEPEGWAELRGIYRLDSGSQLTLFGRHGMYELDGEQVHLIADGSDRYVDADGEGEVLTVDRRADGTISGVTLERPGQEPAVGLREEPYEEREIRFGGQGASLVGDLLIPTGPGPHPAVAIVHGAEAGTREVYRLLATHFARRGVAALIYDKRGVGESTGSFADATFDDLSADALAAVGLLRHQPAIDSERVGLVGFSQGGWVVAMAANRSEDVAFVVALSASGFTPAEQAAWLSGSMLAVRGFDQRPIDTAGRAWAMMYSSLDLVDAGLMPRSPHLPGLWFHALDPYVDTTALWEQVRQPVFALWGELDCQVPAYDSAAALRDALERGPNDARVLRVLPGADHGLALFDACERELGLATGHRYRHAEGYLDGPAEWILSEASDGGNSRGELTLPEHKATSRLGWHMTTSTDAPWFGSLLPQLVLIPLLMGLFAWLGLPWLARQTVGRLGRSTRQLPLHVHLWSAAALVGLAATLTGALAIVELLMLADLHAALLLGGPSVAGASTLYVAASLLAGLAIALAFAAGVTTGRAVRSGRTRAGARSVIALLTLGPLAAWAGYWGFLPLPG